VRHAVPLRRHFHENAITNGGRELYQDYGLSGCVMSVNNGIRIMKNKQGFLRRLTSTLALLTGGLTCLIGLTVLIGWHTHNLLLLHIHPSFVAMAYNTALGFFLCGAGLIAITLNRPRFAIAGGCYGVLFGTLTIGEYLVEHDFGIDELFMKSYTNAGVTNNARMAFNSALSFLLLGIFQMLAAKRTRAPGFSWKAALIGSLVTGMGIIALSGYFIDISHYYAWGHFTRMAVHTALGFVLLGVGVLSYAWHGDIADTHSAPSWLPIPVGVGILSLTICLWQATIVAQGVQMIWLHQMIGRYSVPDSVIRMNSLLPIATLATGAILSIVISWMVYLTQINRMRARQVAGANIDLNREIAVRAEAEEALRHAHDSLEMRVQERTAELSAANAALQEQIATRERLENQLLQAQKLESIGRLAGGVAHDFNNMLTAILGYTNLIVEECPLNEEGQEYLQNVTHAANRATNLTRQLLSFARKQVIEPKVVNLNALSLSLHTMLYRLIGDNIQLEMLLEDALHSVKVDPGQFEQILVNLIVNARDAMPDGGKVTIETHNAVLDEEYALEHEGVVPGEYVMLAVSDTGTGMEEGIRLHIFEPFFTTKEKGRGTGLGLATVYGIVRQAGGHIWLYSEPGEGTTFKIYLPRTLEAVEEPAAHKEQTDQQDGTESVLLVEDDPSVRALVGQTLRKRGYTVLEADNGEEALRLVRESATKIDLLITDVLMPGITGKELSDQLQIEYPSMKVLFVSGYTENTIVHHGVLDPGVAFLSKPFTSPMLTQRVREVLDKS
jgi:signal transduction histidine kinase